MMLVNNPGDWENAYAPLLHAKWHGWTFTDVIFPFFIWIVGAAIPLSASKRLASGQSTRALMRHALRRTLIIFAIGLFLNSFSYIANGSIFRLGIAAWTREYLLHVRIPGVLQRIAICYGFAVAFYLKCSWKGLAIAIAGLLLGYWAVMAGVSVPGCGRGMLTPECNPSGYIDNLLLNGPIIGTHVWKTSRTWDPEGLLSTVPAVATCLFGVLAGKVLMLPLTPSERTSWLFTGGALATLAGLLLNPWFPINKNLWTSSYCALTAGLATTSFAVIFWLVDVKEWKAGARPCAIYGMNAIAVFVLSGVLGRLIIDIKLSGSSLKTILYDRLHPLFSDPRHSSLAWAILWVLFLYIIAWSMHRRKWYVRF